MIELTEHQIEARYGIPGTVVEIDPFVESSSRLSKICYASCQGILTRDQTMVLRTIGVLSDSLTRQIEDCLKQVLDTL